MAPVCTPGAAAFLGSWLSAHGGLEVLIRGSVRGGGDPLWEGGELAGTLARCRHSSLRGLLPAQAGQGVSVLDVWAISLRCRKSIDHLGERILSRSFVISVLLCLRGVRFGLGPHVRET